ncbi:hypothetical protein GCM10027511_21910 [Hymenobacter humi]
MKATLYLPSQPPLDISTEDLSLPDPATGLAKIPKRVSALLGCAPELVDVLACGPGYVAYSVFDSEGDINLNAMTAVTKATGVRFDTDDEDTVLLGPILMVE